MSSTWRTHSHSAESSTCPSAPISRPKADQFYPGRVAESKSATRRISYMGEAVAAIRLIREQLIEVVGRRTATAVAETRIQQLLRLYGEEEEGIRCALHTLLEEVFNEEDQDGFVVFDKEEIASVSTQTLPDFTMVALFSGFFLLVLLHYFPFHLLPALHVSTLFAHSLASKGCPTEKNLIWALPKQQSRDHRLVSILAPGKSLA